MHSLFFDDNGWKPNFFGCHDKYFFYSIRTFIYRTNRLEMAGSRSIGGSRIDQKE